MRWSLVLLASCVPPPVEHPAGIEVTFCHLAPVYEGPLRWPARGTELVCTAKNDLGAPREVCFQPVVGVRQTGAVYTTHDMVCSGELDEGASEALTVKLDMSRELCQMDRGGCVVHAFAVDWPKPADPDPIVTLARTLEAKAVQPGRDRPSVAECEVLVDRWDVSGHNEALAACLGLSRATFACVTVAADPRAAEACGP